MNRKKYIIGAVLALIIGVNIYILTAHQFKKHNTETVFSALSQRTNAFLYIKNLDSLKSKLDSLSYRNKLEGSNFLQASLKEINQLQLINSGIREKFPKYKDLAIGINHVGSGKIGFINIINFNDYISETQVKQFFKSYELPIKSYKFQDFKIYQVENFNQSKIQYCIYNNLLLLSTNGPLLEESLNAISSQKSKQQNVLFQKLLTKLSHSADLHLFIDYTQNDLKPVIENNYSSLKNEESQKIADWSYSAINFNENKVLFNTSFSYFNINETELGNLIKSEPSPFTLDQYLPNNTAYFEAITSKENVSFQTNDASFDYLKDWLGYEVAFFCLETFDEDFQKRSGLMLKAKNIDTAKVNLYLLNKEMTPISTFEGVAIYEMNTKTMAKLCRHQFIKIDKPFFVFLKDVVVFSDQLNVLRTLIQKTKEKKFLAAEKNYHLKRDSISNKIIYLKPSRCKIALQNLFQENFLPPEMGAMQINFVKQNDNILASGEIDFTKIENNKTAKLWTSVLDTVSQFKPQLVLNADNMRKEIFTQDEANTIYLINQSGEIFLKKPFNNKIISDVYQIDLYKANKLFYVFNTETHIYVMKRNGAILDGYPIKLPSKATNGMLVVNYDKAKNYRFFVACANDKVYGYQANGKPLKGWSPLPGNFQKVFSPISYTVFDGRDYIYFHNEKGSFFAFNRKGEQRFPGVNLATPFVNAFETFNKGFVNFSEGSVYKIDLKGNTTAKVLTDSTYQFFTNYATKDAFAIASNQEFRVAKSKWTILGKRRLNDSIKNINQVNLNGKTWFLVTANASTYILNDLGEIHKAFPMLSSAQARISSFYSVPNQVLLIQEDEKLHAYELIVSD